MSRLLLTSGSVTNHVCDSLSYRGTMFNVNVDDGFLVAVLLPLPLLATSAVGSDWKACAPRKPTMPPSPLSPQMTRMTKNADATTSDDGRESKVLSLAVAMVIVVSHQILVKKCLFALFSQDPGLTSM